MLNNNPLAIKLVTSNLPKNKNLQSLKNELDNDFFDITSKDIENNMALGIANSDALPGFLGVGCLAGSRRAVF